MRCPTRLGGKSQGRFLDLLELKHGRELDKRGHSVSLALLMTRRISACAAATDARPPSSVVHASGGPTGTTPG